MHVFNNNNITSDVHLTISSSFFSISANNNLGGTLAGNIGAMTNLKTLMLSTNNIKGKIPNKIHNAIRLEYIDLSQNQLTGSLPNQFPQDLEAFIVWGNNLDRNIPQSIFQIKTLIHLNLGTLCIRPRLLGTRSLPAIDDVLVFVTFGRDFLLKKLGRISYFLSSPIFERVSPHFDLFRVLEIYFV